jgi:hypothetical protein
MAKIEIALIIFVVLFAIALHTVGDVPIIRPIR